MGRGGDLDVTTTIVIKFGKYQVTGVGSYETDNDSIVSIGDEGDQIVLQSGTVVVFFEEAADISVVNESGEDPWCSMGALEPGRYELTEDGFEKTT